MKKDYYIIKSWISIFEEGASTAGDGNTGAAGDGNTGAAAGNTGAAAGGGGGGAAGKAFTQDDVNRMLAEEKRKHQSQTKKAIEELEALKAKATLTDAERQELEGRLDTMKNELLTRDELAKKEQDKLTRKYTEETKKLETERDAWQQRFTVSTIQRSITDASVANGAYSPKQIVAILQPDTRLVEALDSEGNPTGELIPKVEFSDLDKDGKPVTLDLTVEEAVKRMSEMDDYANLFKSSGVGGIGSRSTGASRTMDLRKIAKDPALYRRMKAEGKLPV